MPTPKVSKMHKRVITETKENSALVTKGDKAIIPNNNMWDELRKFHSSTFFHLSDFGEKVYDQVKMQLGTPELRAKIKNEANLAGALTLLAKDISSQRDILDKIMATQTGFGNSIESSTEIATMLQIYGEYSDAVEVFNNVVQPTMGIIAQELGALDEVIQKSQQSATQAPKPTTESEPVVDPVTPIEIVVQEQKIETVQVV